MLKKVWKEKKVQERVKGKHLNEIKSWRNRENKRE